MRGLSVFLLLALLLGLFYNLSTLPLRKEIAVLASRVGQRIIVLDPGHGGFDGGARGLSGVEEEEIVLEVARYLPVPGRGGLEFLPGMRMKNWQKIRWRT